MSIFEKEALHHSKMKSSKWISNFAAEVQSTSILKSSEMKLIQGKKSKSVRSRIHAHFCTLYNFPLRTTPLLFSKDKLEYQMTAWHIQLSLLQKKDWNWLSQILNLLFGKKRSLIIEFGKMNSEALGLSSWKVLLGKGKMKNECMRFVNLGIVTYLV